MGGGKNDGRYLVKNTDNMKGLKCFNQTEKKALATWLGLISTICLYLLRI